MNVITFECGICLTQTSIKECLTLSCDHRFGKECLVMDWTEKIKSSKISRSHFICPQEKCGTPITLYEMRANLPCAIYETYQRKCNEAFQTNLSSKEVYVVCPNKDCKTPYFICRGASFFSCEFCKRKSCADCMGDMKEHENITCEEYQEKNTSPEEYAFKKTFVGQQCPHCKVNAQKTGGCNFMTCPSTFCQNINYFCYLCGISLKKTECSSHFNGQPFGDKCKTTIEKEAKGDFSMKGINKIVKLVKKNEKGCPKCGSHDPEVCQIDKNLNYKISVCKVCKIYCLDCKIEIKEADIFDHIHPDGEK